MFSEARMSDAFKATSSALEDTICSRCEGLDLVRLLETYPPWNTQSELVKAFEEGHELIINLGQTGTIKFWTDCAVCCCLFALTPNPGSAEQEVLILPDWTICRLAGENGVALEIPEKRNYATCLVAVVKPSTVGLPVPIRAHRGDALCLLEEDLGPQRTLGGKLISSNRIDINVVQGWLSSCMELHEDACAPVKTSQLHGVRFIDVENKTIVAYPGHDSDYVALSYVWGHTIQKSYRLGETVGRLPRTLEDAISYTKLLGKRYLWVDSLCIDQSDTIHKADQINRMWSIYRGSYVTIIALSGDSADAGLSRITRSASFPQLTCCVRNKRLVGLMPTLSQQMWVCTWGQRAWTFQEAFLAPRCLFVSDHQLYFDCNAMQCCESLNQTRSWGHNLTQSSNTSEMDFTVWMIRQVGSGALRDTVDTESTRFINWGSKVTLYTYRNMTYAEDGLRAFMGALQRFQATSYPRGFCWGLPVEDLDWALLWRSQWPPQRREGFPTWSWAGWKGGVWAGNFIDPVKDIHFSTYLEIHTRKAGHLENIFSTRVGSSASDGYSCTVLREDCIDIASRQDPHGRPFSPVEYPSAEETGLLLVDAVCFHFVLDFGYPLQGIRANGRYETFRIWIRDVPCTIVIMSTDTEITRRPSVAPESFILIARIRSREIMVHHLILVRPQKNADSRERVTALELRVLMDRLDALAELMPRRQRIVLA